MKAAIQHDTKDSNLELLDTTEAAALLGCSIHTLKGSRHFGSLFGSPAPAFIKMGRIVRYRRQTLIDWLSQFEEKPNTAC